MENPEVSAVVPREDPAKTLSAAQDSSAATTTISNEAIEQNVLSSAANANLKDLSISSSNDSTNPPAVDQPPASLTATSNGVNGVIVNGSAHKLPPVAADTAPTTDDGDTVMTIDHTENKPADVAISSDPGVQQPTSDLRSSTGPPVSEEQVSEIKEAKQQSDLASDRELATGIAKSSTAPIERSLTPTQTGDAMDLSIPADEKPSSELNIPYHPPALTTDESADPVPTPKDATPTLPPTTQETDTAMTDVPASPGKIAREREDEEADEPATKRLKADGGEGQASFKVPDLPTASSTEEQKTGNTATVTAATSTTSDAGPYPGEVSTREKKPDWDGPITPLQNKHLRKTMGIIKRGTYAFSFKQPVDPVALNIPTYFDHIKTPMDLSVIEQKLQNETYSSVSELWDDLDLIVQNSVTFNGRNHGVTQAAFKMRESYDFRLNNTPLANEVETKGKQQKKRDSIDKQPTRRRESRSSGAAGTGSNAGDNASGNAGNTDTNKATNAGAGQAKSPVAASPTQTFALGPTGVPTIRRDSTIADGRPRREIHPPAPKDLPYSNQRPRKKKFQWELKWCQDVLNEFKKPKYSAIAYPFLQPVDPVALNIPTYHKIIKKPMDLSTMETKLKAGEYENAKEFDTDMRLMFQNCYKFNPADDGIHKAGKNLEGLFDERLEHRKEWIKSHSPNAPLSPESSPEASEDEEEEEDEEDSEDDPAVQQISELEKQLEALKRQVNQEKKKKTPPTKGKKSKKAAEAPPKKGKAAAGGSKKAKGVKAEKKDSKAKKATKIPYVTYEQKQDISARINNLPENRMQTALNIIRDNMPNLKGVQDDEIELDIDELSNEVLYKLLTFVRKYAPLPEDEPVARPAPPPAATSSKPKKSKPMGKHEQEARIRELKEKLNGIDNDDSDGEGAGGPEKAVESSGDEDDSEESEED